MKFSSVIIEDLPVAAEYLRHCCDKSGKIEVKAHFTSIKEAISFLTETSVDILFLDIEMQDENGFDVLSHLVYTPQVILTTAKAEYAYSAFEHNVTDFLKKPFIYQRFLAAIEKAIAKINSSLHNKQVTEDDSIFIKTDGKLVRLQNEKILFIESIGDYVWFVTMEKKYLSHNTIKHLEEKLNPSMFMKVHRSFIVNINKVHNIEGNILFINNYKIPVSKANRMDVLRKINHV
ncbi:MAG: LytTR family DNA-binding domain-containing protein [Chitinophagaceae bacterium]